LRSLTLSAQTLAIFDRFTQQLGRLSRKFGDKSLQMAAVDVIDYHEAKSLDRDTLAAIALVIFGISGLP
jgi:hypothetical protein